MTNADMRAKHTDTIQKESRHSPEPLIGVTLNFLVYSIYKLPIHETKRYSNDKEKSNLLYDGQLVFIHVSPPFSLEIYLRSCGQRTRPLPACGALRFPSLDSLLRSCPLR